MFLGSGEAKNFQSMHLKKQFSLMQMLWACKIHIQAHQSMRLVQTFSWHFTQKIANTFPRAITLRGIGQDMLNHQSVGPSSPNQDNSTAFNVKSTMISGKQRIFFEKLTNIPKWEPKLCNHSYFLSTNIPGTLFSQGIGKAIILNYSYKSRRSFAT